MIAMRAISNPQRHRVVTQSTMPVWTGVKEPP